MEADKSGSFKEIDVKDPLPELILPFQGIHIIQVRDVVQGGYSRSVDVNYPCAEKFGIIRMGN